MLRSSKITADQGVSVLGNGSILPHDQPGRPNVPKALSPPKILDLLLRR